MSLLVCNAWAIHLLFWLYVFNIKKNNFIEMTLDTCCVCQLSLGPYIIIVSESNRRAGGHTQWHDDAFSCPLSCCSARIPALFVYWWSALGRCSTPGHKCESAAAAAAHSSWTLSFPTAEPHSLAQLCGSSYCRHKLDTGITHTEP